MKALFTISPFIFRSFNNAQLLVIAILSNAPEQRNQYFFRQRFFCHVIRWESLIFYKSIGIEFKQTLLQALLDEE
jgi:hypothetical protein